MCVCVWQSQDQSVLKVGGGKDGGVSGGGREKQKPDPSRPRLQRTDREERGENRIRKLETETIHSILDATITEIL